MPSATLIFKIVFHHNDLFFISKPPSLCVTSLRFRLRMAWDILFFSLLFEKGDRLLLVVFGLIFVHNFEETSMLVRSCCLLLLLRRVKGIINDDVQ